MLIQQKSTNQDGINNGTHFVKYLVLQKNHTQKLS